MNVHRADPQLRVTALIAVVVTLVAGVALFVALQRWFAMVTKLPSAEALAQLLTAFAWATGRICAAISGLLRAVGGLAGERALLRSGRCRVRTSSVTQRPSAAAPQSLAAMSCKAPGAALLLCTACVIVEEAWRLYHALSGAVYSFVSPDVHQPTSPLGVRR